MNESIDSRERALLDAIVAAPEDDEPRLVYADLLEERGNPRGELIQIQCRLERLPPGADAPELRAREDVLLREHTRTWLGELWARGVPKTRFEFRRGFLEKMISPLANATRHADRIIAEAPLVRDLELSIHGQTDRVELARPTSAALLSRASALTILGRHRGETRGGLGPRGRFEGLARVAFPRLRSLALRTLRVTSPDIASFLARQRALESLSLTLNLDAEALAVPLREHGFPELRRLLLARNTVGRICSRLIDAGLDERLVELDLSFTGMFDEDLRALLRKPWSMLRRLGIAYNALTRASLDHLAAWDGAPELEELDLRRLVNGVGVELILQRKWPKARILI